MTDTPTSLVDRTLSAILRGILSEAYGETLPPQDVLSRDLGVSRTVLREALAVLRFCNVLDVRPKTGTKINERRVWKKAILEGVEQ